MKKYIFESNSTKEIKEFKKISENIEKKEKLQEMTMVVATVDDAILAIQQAMEFISMRKAPIPAAEIVNSTIVGGLDKMANAKVKDPDRATAFSNRIKKMLIMMVRGSIV